MLIEKSDLFCHDLPSTFQPKIGKILVTGASGYIGGLLVPELIARGYSVRVMVRAASPANKERWPGAEITIADAHDYDNLKKALNGVDTAYFLIHSLLLGHKEFESADIEAAINFRKAAEENNIKRIIYLGGLGDSKSSLSPHLRSRIDVAIELSKGKVPATILRAAIIIGSGSASYGIIKHLVKNIPILPIPYWARTKCQSIAIRDVIKYLVGVLEKPETSGRSYDIGGSDILTYEMMLKILADLLNKKRMFIPFPYSAIGFYAYIGGLVTPVPSQITRCLMEGIKNEVVCRDDSIKEVLPFQPYPFKRAILAAMSREEQDKIHTRWSDAYPPGYVLAMKLHELQKLPRFRSSYSIFSKKPTSSLFQSICKIGGKEGWFNSNTLWRLRGVIDRILMGVGTSRGRRSSSSLRVNDVIDFWRVEDLKPEKRLLLRAEMKLPGMAWLEFLVTDQKENGNQLSVIAYYEPRGIFGMLYWYIFLPFHLFIFYDLIKEIEKQS